MRTRPAVGRSPGADPVGPAGGRAVIMLCMSTIDPPFRADHVGSLLRPPALFAARQQCADGDDHGPRAPQGRGCRDRRRGRQARIDRDAGRDRWRVPPDVVPSRLPRTARRCRRDGQHRRQLRRRHDRPPDTAEADGRRTAAAHATTSRSPTTSTSRRWPPRRRRSPSPHRRWCTSAAVGRGSTSTPTRTWKCSSPTWRRCTAPRSTPCTRLVAGTSSSTTRTSPTCVTR